MTAASGYSSTATRWRLEEENNSAPQQDDNNNLKPSNFQRVNSVITSKPSQYHNVHSKLAGTPAAHAGTEKKLQTMNMLGWFLGNRKIVELMASPSAIGQAHDACISHSAQWAAWMRKLAPPDGGCVCTRCGTSLTSCGFRRPSCCGCGIVFWRRQVHIRPYVVASALLYDVSTLIL